MRDLSDWFAIMHVMDMFQIGSSPHGKYGLVAAGSHIFPWTALRQIFIWNIFTKATLPSAAFHQAGQRRTRTRRKAGRRWRKNSDQSIDGWLQLFCFFLEENHAWRRQQFIALAGQSNGKLESFVSLLCKYWCYRQLFCGSAAHLVECLVSHSCCRRYLQLIFWNYTSLITPLALYSFPALS